VRTPLQTAGTCLMVLLLLFCAATIEARERTGTICGIVVDELGHGLARADVFLMDRDGSTLLESALTDSRGRFLFHGLFPQDYQLRAEKPGYRTADLGPVSARSGQQTTAPFVLQPHPGLQAAVGDAPGPADCTLPAQLTPVEPRKAAEGTLAETLAGTSRDALKALDRPGLRGTATAAQQPQAGTAAVNGDLVIASGGSGASGDHSILVASLAGRGFGPMRWTVELSRENIPTLSQTGLGGPLLWRVVRTETAAFELTTMPTTDNGIRQPEQSFRLELTEQYTAGKSWDGQGVRSLTAGWTRTNGNDDNQVSLDLLYAAGREDIKGGRQPALLLLDGRYTGQWSPDHRLTLHWRHGSLDGSPHGLPVALAGHHASVPGGVLTPLAEGWETVIHGSNRWQAAEPLQLLCRLEYRITETHGTTRVARPSLGLVYEPFERSSVTSNVGLALRTGPAGDEAPGRRHSELEYGLLLEQGFGRGYNLELDLAVEDLQPGSLTEIDPSRPFGPPAGGMIFLSRGGSARTREMTLSLTKDFGLLLDGRLGTSLLDGQGDIMAIPALPGHKEQWAGSLGGTGRVRGVSGHFDTFLPAVGTGILVTIHRLTNLESGLLDRHRGPAGEFTGLDVGLRQRLLHTAGLDLQLLMAVSSLTLNEHSFQGLVDSLVGDTSQYRRIVGGLRVHF